MSVRFDSKTGKAYTFHNIPVDNDEYNTVSIENEKGYFKIFSENHNHPEDSWYEGRFIGDRYAVFKWSESGFYQQISQWYKRYSTAVKKLHELAKG